MILSQVVRRLTVAAVAVLGIAGSAAAQSGPYIAPDVKGFRAYQLRNNYYQRTTAQPAATAPQYATVQAPTVISSSPVVISSTPTVISSTPAFVSPGTVIQSQPAIAAAPTNQPMIAIRGSDGVLRYYQTTGTSNGVIVVNPGQPTTAQAMPSSR